MLEFHFESRAAIAPGLETQDDRKRWLQNPAAIEKPLGKADLDAVPAIAAAQGLALNRLIEAAVRLEQSERVLYLAYDSPRAGA